MRSAFNILGIHVLAHWHVYIFFLVISVFTFFIVASSGIIFIVGILISLFIGLGDYAGLVYFLSAIPTLVYVGFLIKIDIFCIYSLVFEALLIKYWFKRYSLHTITDKKLLVATPGESGITAIIIEPQSGTPHEVYFLSNTNSELLHFILRNDFNEQNTIIVGKIVTILDNINSNFK